MNDLERYSVNCEIEASFHQLVGMGAISAETRDRYMEPVKHRILTEMEGTVLTIMLDNDMKRTVLSALSAIMNGW